MKDFIEEFVNENYINSNLLELSEILNIPINNLKDKSKQLLLNKFNFKKGKFNLNNSKFKIFSDYLIFIFLTFSQLLNTKIFKKKEKEKIDLMLDNVTNTDEIYRFKNILEKYENNLIVLKKKISYDKISFRKLKIIYKRYFYNSSEFLRGKLRRLLMFGYKIFKLSFKKKFNFFQVINVILNSSIRYQNLFENYDVKFLIHDRSYTTCPIRNFLLKKKCNGTTGFVQVHLAESVISMFNFTDIIFSFGNEVNTKDKIKKLGGQVSSSFAVGSLKAEHLISNKIDNTNSKFSSDILIIGVNVADWFFISKTTSRAYLNFLDYIKKLSFTFPNKRIIYKHHANFRWDSYEENLLKKTNVKIFIENNEIKNKNEYLKKIVLKKKLNFFNYKSSSKKDTKFDGYFSGSYNFIKNAKFVISFSSTMILEAEILNKPAYFINPEGVESTFFQELNYLNEKIITNFEDLENKILDNEKISKMESDNICIKGQPGYLIKRIIDDNLNEKFKNAR